MNNDTMKTEYQAAYDAGRQMLQRYDRNEFHEAAIVHPDCSKVSVLPVRKQVRPEFLVATRLFHEPERFAEYVNQFSDANTRMWHTSEGAFTCIIDDHQTDQGMSLPRHGDHIARLVLRESPEWGQWIKQNQSPLGQQEFAEFIEDHHADFLEPDGTHMTEVATGLQATTSGQFKSARNLGNGSINFAFDEEVQGMVKGGSMEVPKQFQVALRPFYGLPRWPVDCLFRYRINSGALRLWYKMLSPEVIIETAISQTVDQLADVTGIRSSLGSSSCR